jgi:glucokinase
VKTVTICIRLDRRSQRTILGLDCSYRSLARTKAHVTSDQDPQVAIQPLAIGAEIGSRGLRAVIGTQDGNILDSIHAIDHSDSALSTVNGISQLIDQLLDRRNLSPSDVRGIGIAFGGPVDTNGGLIIRSHRTPGFDNFPIAGIVEERFGIPVCVENDARAGAIGEFRFGSGRGSHNMIFLQLGIGIGGGIIVDGKIVHGTTMTAGELGHMAVSTDGPRCSCGKPGHLEAYASELAIVERMRIRLTQATPTATAAWLASPGVTLRRIFAAYGNDEDATAVIDETVQVVGLALANLITALNSDTVVLGGYALEIGAPFVSAVRAKIRQYAFESAARRVNVAPSDLAGDAAVIGAISLVFE